MDWLTKLVRNTLLFIYLILSVHFVQAQWAIERFAGVGLGEEGPALQVPIIAGMGIYVDASGNIYFGDAEMFRLRKVNASTGLVETTAGDGSRETRGLVNPQLAGIGFVTSVMKDSNGDIYFTSNSEHKIFRIDATNQTLRTIASSLQRPTDLFLASDGFIYIAQEDGNVISKVNKVTGAVTHVAGTGVAGFNGDDLNALSTQLNKPTNVFVATNGDIFFADRENQRIRKVRASDNKIETIAGSGNSGFSGDGGIATSANLSNPTDLILDVSGNLLFCDSSNDRIRKVNASDGFITTIAGIGGASGFEGDGGAATAARLFNPVSLFLDSGGNLYFMDAGNHRIRKIDTNGIITTVVGNGLGSYGGDGGVAKSALLGLPEGVVVDKAGNVYITEWFNHRIRLISGASGEMSTIVGTGIAGFGGDGGAASTAQLSRGGAMTFSSDSVLYFADEANHRIRKIDLKTNIITTIAGNGIQGFSGDGGQATAASFSEIKGLALDIADKNLYVSDHANGRVRKIDLSTGIITTVAGTVGTLPLGILIDQGGNLVFGNGSTIQKVDLSGGGTSTFAGTGNAGFSGDGGSATAAQLSERITAIVQNKAGEIFFADQWNYRIRKIDGSGNISTIAGRGIAGESDGAGDALKARFSQISGLYFAEGIGLYVVDRFNNTVWRLIDEPPVPPTLSSLTFVRDTSGQKQVTIAWKDNSANESSFVIEKSSNGTTNFVALATLAPNTTQLVDTLIKFDTTYAYRVKAINIAGSVLSNVLDTAFIYTPPAQPINTTIAYKTKAENNAPPTSTINISWTDTATDEDGYKIERSENETNNFSVIATLKKNTTSHEDTDLQPNVQYYYRLKAFNADGESAYSSIVSFVLVGVENEQLKQQTTVFPNPATQNTHLKMQNNYQGNVEVLLINKQGIPMLDIQYQKNSFQLNKTLNLRGMAAGFYFMKITTGQVYTLKKLIKK